MLGAVALGALGYAEGGALARDLGGWPGDLLGAGAVAAGDAAGTALRSPRPHGGLSAGADAWLGFAYVALVSMFLAFFAWYAGLARGGVAKIGQIQLAQPVLTLGWAAPLLGEQVGAATLLAALAVLASVVPTQRTRVEGWREAPERDGRR